MGAVEEIRQMKSLGREESEIFGALQKRGYTPEELTNAFAQTRIKEAIVESDNNTNSQNDLNLAFSKEESNNLPDNTQTMPENMQDMSPSLLTKETDSSEISANISPYPSPVGQTSQYPENQYPETPYQPSYASQDYFPQYEQAEYPSYPNEMSYPQYPQQEQFPAYQLTISPDTITEIAEQIISEKISPIDKKIDKGLQFKNEAETKLENLSERIERIEKILDKLQLSILDKVGQYATDVSDIKNEIQETQKTFSSLIAQHNQDSRKKKSKNK